MNARIDTHDPTSDAVSGISPALDPQAAVLVRELAATAPEAADRLQELLDLPAEELLQRLLGPGPDDPDGPNEWLGYASPTTLA
jgi:hypothetical protein